MNIYFCGWCLLLQVTIINFWMAYVVTSFFHINTMTSYHPLQSSLQVGLYLPKHLQTTLSYHKNNASRKRLMPCWITMTSNNRKTATTTIMKSTTKGNDDTDDSKIDKTRSSSSNNNNQKELNNNKNNNNKEQKNNNDNNNKSGSIKPKPISMIEDAVQSITGDTNYKFGDYSKRAVSDTKDVLTETGKVVTGDDTYEFGDITKGILNEAGKAVTGDDNYQFGDITRSVLNDMEKSLEIWNGNAFQELPNQLWNQAFSNMDRPQKQASIVALIRLLAIALLTWGFVSNICTVLSITMAWTKSCWSIATLSSSSTTAIPQRVAKNVVTATNGATSIISWNPFNIGLLQRQIFLNTYTMLQLILYPFFLIIQGAGTLYIYLRYQRFVFHVEQNWFTNQQRTKYPLLYRVGALGMAFACNMSITFLMTIIGIYFGTTIGYIKYKNWLWF